MLVTEVWLAGRPSHPLGPLFSLPITGVFAFKFLTLAGHTVRGELYLHQLNMLPISHQAGRTILY